MGKGQCAGFLGCDRSMVDRIEDEDDAGRLVGLGVAISSCPSRCRNARKRLVMSEIGRRISHKPMPASRLASCTSVRSGRCRRSARSRQRPAPNPSKITTWSRPRICLARLCMSTVLPMPPAPWMIRGAPAARAEANASSTIERSIARPTGERRRAWDRGDPHDRPQVQQGPPLGRCGCCCRPPAPL